MLQCIILGKGKNTPRLDIHGNDRLSSRLGFALLLLLVFSQALVSNSLGLRIFFLVIATEKVDFIIFFLCRWCLSWVQRKGRCLWTIGCVCLGSITRESGKFISVRSNMLVPSRSVGVFCSIWGGGKGLEGDYIGLGRGVSVWLSIS
jgi:hypothetical protein